MEPLGINGKNVSDRTQWRQAIKEQGEPKFRDKDFEQAHEQLKKLDAERDSTMHLWEKEESPMSTSTMLGALAQANKGKKRRRRQGHRGDVAERA